MREGLRVIAMAVIGMAAGDVPAVAQDPAASSAAPALTVPARATPKPPFPHRANDLLPSWLHVRGELRERVEGGRGIGFTGDRNDLYALTRVRLHATVTPMPLLSFQVQAQDARVAGQSIGATGAPFSAPFDMRMAFVDLGSDRSSVALRGGRQELAFGEQRLVGHVGWLT